MINNTFKVFIRAYHAVTSSFSKHFSITLPSYHAFENHKNVFVRFYFCEYFNFLDLILKILKVLLFV